MLGDLVGAGGVERPGHPPVGEQHDAVGVRRRHRVVLLADGRLAGTLDVPTADKVAEHLARLGA